MLQAYTDNTQNLAANQTIKFDYTVVNNTPCAISFNEGTSSIKLKKQGYYLVQFNATAIATAAGDISIQMFIDGEASSQALAKDTLDAVGDLSNLSFSSIVPIKCSCCAVDNSQTITFSNTGIDTSLSLANVIITKIA